MTTGPGANPDPDPSDATGLEPGGGVPPGETPPDSGSSGAGPVTPGHGGRTWGAPLLIGLGLLAVVVVVALFAVGRAMG